MSDVKGVYYDNHMRRWIGRLQYKGVVHRKGFVEKNDAIKHRKDLEDMYIPKQVTINKDEVDTSKQVITNDSEMSNETSVDTSVEKNTEACDETPRTSMSDVFNMLDSLAFSIALDQIIRGEIRAIKEKKALEKVRPKNFCMKNESFDMIYGTHFQGFSKVNTKTHLCESGSFKVDSIRFKLIYNDNATIVIFENGIKGVAICGKEDTFSRKAGLECAFGRAYGNYLLDKFKN